MRQFKHHFVVRAPLEKVIEFHQDTRVLKRLTPPPVIVQFHYLDPLADKSVAEFTMWFGPFPVRWRAVHQVIDLTKGFTDVQESGPFQIWVHYHRFDSIETGKTEVSDEIHAEPGAGLAWLVSTVMWFSLPLLFVYRGWVTRRMLEKGS